LKVQYHASGSATDEWVEPYLQIVNTGSTSVPYSELTVRYWYTYDTDGNTPVLSCFYAKIGCANVNKTFNVVNPARTGANRYLELTFTSGAGNLAAGTNSGDMQIAWRHADWSNWNEANDYSYDGTKMAFADWTHVTLYRNGVLAWGTEP
jgi:hypothetical protein